MNQRKRGIRREESNMLKERFLYDKPKQESGVWADFYNPQPDKYSMGVKHTKDVESVPTGKPQNKK